MTARDTIRRELKRTDNAFDTHVANHGCVRKVTCIVRAKYQERLSALAFAIRAMGGRPRINYFGRSVAIIADTTIPELSA